MKKPSPTRLPSLVVLAALAVAAVGCNKIQHTGVEDLIKQDLAKKGQAVKSVSCPEGRTFQQDSFDCTGVDAAGKPLTIKVNFRPTEGGKADVRYSVSIDGKAYAN